MQHLSVTVLQPTPDVHTALGELSSEQEQFESAIQDYTIASGLLETVPPDDMMAMRKRASLLYQLSLIQLLVKDYKPSL